MYEGDSLFTLAPAHQVGLIALSGVMGGPALLLIFRLTRARAPGWRIAIAAAIYVLFLWLSPQMHYAYYRSIIEGLPAQWVIAALPDPVAAATLVLFADRATIAAHANGAFGWLGLIVAVLAPRINLVFKK